MIADRRKVHPLTACLITKVLAPVIGEAGEQQAMLLMLTLETAVPLHVAGLVRLPWEDLWARIKGRQSELASLLGEKGDVLQFKVKGETAKAFNALSEGVALMSFVEGGIRCFGLRFRSYHPEAPYDNHAQRAGWESCPDCGAEKREGVRCVATDCPTRPPSESEKEADRGGPP